MIQHGSTTFNLTTVNATPTVLAEIPITATSLGLLTAYVVAKRTDGNALSMHIERHFNVTAAGSPPALGVNSVISMINTTGVLGLLVATASIEAVAGALRVVATGQAGQTITWECIIEMRRTA